jgi:hypothetical protein
MPWAAPVTIADFPVSFDTGCPQFAVGAKPKKTLPRDIRVADGPVGRHFPIVLREKRATYVR